MRKDKLISDYTAWTDFELSTLAGRVLAAMQAPAMTALFPAPDPGLDELEEMVGDFIIKHEVASRRGSALEVSLKNEAREVLIKGLKRLAHHANGVADGQTSALLSTGLVLASARQRMELPTIPQRVRLRDGRISGQMRLDFHPVREAWEYEVSVGESEFGSEGIQWIRTLTTTSSRGNVLTDVVPGLVYHVRMRARNAKGYGDWSDMASLLCR